MAPQGVSVIWVLTCDRGADSAAGSPLAGEGHLPWGTGLDEVVQNLVRDGLVEDALVAIALQVELEALEFDARAVGDVGDVDGAEIGLVPRGWSPLPATSISERVPLPEGQTRYRRTFLQNWFLGYNAYRHST